MFWRELYSDGGVKNKNNIKYNFLAFTFNFYRICYIFRTWYNMVLL